jgi:hypothetical protein
MSAGGGRTVRLEHLTITLLDVRVAAGLDSATAATVRASARIGFDEPQVSVLGAQLPDAATAALAAVFGGPIPLTGLPDGLVVNGLTATPDGVAVSLTARQVTFRRE